MLNMEPNLEGTVFYHDITSWAIGDMKEDVMRVMKVFYEGKLKQ
ncbi:hypothetical protein [Clostridium thailandense]|nr:hypothetical protein [Clostridium thailandense]